MKTSYDRGKSSKSQTIKANETIPSHRSRNGNQHEKQTAQSTSRRAHPRNHGENAMPCQAENILPGWREAQMSDVCNGNFPLGHISGEISCKTSEKFPHRVTNMNRNEEGVVEKVSATQKVRGEPKDSPSKAVFTFWANKVNSSSSKTTAFQKLLQKSPLTAGSCSPALLPKEGLRSLEEEKQVQNPQRKTRRDLFSDSKVFSHVDTHVLHVSQQVGPGVLQ